MTIPIIMHKYTDFPSLSPGGLEWGGTHKYVADFGNELGGIREGTNQSRWRRGSWVTFIDLAVLLVLCCRIAGGHYRVVCERSSTAGVFCSRIGGPFHNRHQSAKYGYASRAQRCVRQEGIADKANFQSACRDPPLRLLRFDWSPQFVVIMTVLKGAVCHQS